MTRRSATAVLLVLAFATHTAAADRARLVVVVVKGSGLTNISKDDLKHCFLGDPVEGGGKMLAPFNAESKTATRAGFDRAILGMSPDEVGRFWTDRRVRGQAAAPRALPSVMHMQKVVAKFPGAIGYIPADQLTSDLQPVNVDGIAYTDSTYSIFAE